MQIQQQNCEIKYLDGFLGYRNLDKPNPRTNINAFLHTAYHLHFLHFSFFTKMMMERLSNVNISFTNNNKYTVGSAERWWRERFFPIIDSMKIYNAVTLIRQHNIRHSKVYFDIFQLIEVNTGYDIKIGLWYLVRLK